MLIFVFFFLGKVQCSFETKNRYFYVPNSRIQRNESEAECEKNLGTVAALTEAELLTLVNSWKSENCSIHKCYFLKKPNTNKIIVHFLTNQKNMIKKFSENMFGFAFCERKVKKQQATNKEEFDTYQKSSDVVEIVLWTCVTFLILVIAIVGGLLIVPQTRVSHDLLLIYRKRCIDLRVKINFFYCLMFS